MPLSETQKIIVQSPQRFKVAVCGRRWGKTTLAIREMCRIASQPNKEIFYVSPTYRQSKMIAWKKLRNKLVNLKWVKKINETELSITLKNGSTISLKGADGGAQNLRGVGLDYLVMDEFSLIDKEAWFEVLRPALSDKMGSALFITTPAGMNWAKDLFDLSESFPDEWASFQFSTIDGGNVSEAEIEAARSTLDERTFRQEYLATFETFSGRVFYAFDRTQHVRPYTQAQPREIFIGMDFNVDPMSAVVIVKLPDNQLHIIDEIRIFGSNTHEMVNEIQSRYHDRAVVCLPDPAGAQRKTSANGATDHIILRQAGFRVIAPNSHSAIRDGVNAVNSKLCSSTGVIGLFVDPRCKYTIETFEKYCYKEGTNHTPDKTSGFDHLADAMRYAIDHLAPIRMPAVEIPIQTWGHKNHIPRGPELRKPLYG